jgi:hypothetical protein
MNFIRLILDRFNDYAYQYASNIEMNILGNFLSSDVGCYNKIYKEWVLHPLAGSISGNITQIEKEGNHIYLSDLYSEDKYPIELKMTSEQFIKILDDWEHKVCALKPQAVTIKYENDEFIFETT